jgi:hypothetical protein
MSDETLDQRIILHYPLPIAFHYQKMLEEKNWEAKTHEVIRVFEYTLRVMNLMLASQYLQQRRNGEFDDAEINKQLHSIVQVPATNKGWVGLFFAFLKNYKGHRDLFFMPELYDLVWESKRTQAAERAGVRKPYDQLVIIRNDVIHGAPPENEAGWIGLWKDENEYLIQILQSLQFLASYELCHIIGKNDAGGYDFETYTGVQVQRSDHAIIRPEGFKGEWVFYSRAADTYLELHPWFLKWWRESIHQSDVALYDYYKNKSLHFLATVAGVNIDVGMQPLGQLKNKGTANNNVFVENKNFIQDFANLVTDVLDAVENKREESHRLTWDLFRQTAAASILQQTSGLMGKYQPDLHVRRGGMEGIYQQFLESDKTCMILVGESGVGKSQFILRQLDVNRDNPAQCCLFYAANYLSTEKQLSQVLTDSFNQIRKFKLKERGNKSVEDIFAEVDLIEMVDFHQVILFIDGLNENKDPNKLLQGIDKMVMEYGGELVKWLKIVVTCRPETWRNIKRGSLKCNHYFSVCAGEDEIELTRFTNDEVKSAYLLHQQKYNVLTRWDDIPMDLRRELQQPLFLWLITSSNAGKPLPARILRSHLYESYIDELLKTQRLELVDLDFLRQDITRLMICGDEPINKLYRDQLIDTQAHSRKCKIDEMIIQNDEVNSGLQINQSFFNLCNARILSIHRQGSDYEIDFQYEGFYEYFGGERLYETNKDRPVAEKVHLYKSLMSRIGDTPYLWGVLKYALQLEIEKKQNVDLICPLAQTEERLSRNLIVTTLVELCGECDERVNKVLHDIIERTLAENDAQRTTPAYNAAYIAITTARRVKFFDLLERASQSSNPTYRSIAVQEYFYYWREDPEGELNLLTKYAEKVKGKFGLPDRSVLEFCIINSALILSENIDWPDASVQKSTYSKLGTIWKEVLHKLGLVHQHRGGASQMITETFIYVLVFLFNGVSNIFGQHRVKDLFPFTFPEIAKFFDLPEAKRRIYGRLIPYVEPDADLHAALPLIEEVAGWREILPIYCLEFVLLNHFEKDPMGTLEILEKVFLKSVSLNPAGTAMPYALIALTGYSSITDQFPPAFAEKMMDYVETAYRHGRGHYMSARGVDYLWLPLMQAACLYHKATGELPPFVDTFIQELFVAALPYPEDAERFVISIADFALQYERFHVRGDTGFLLMEKVHKASVEKLGASDQKKIRTAILDALSWIYVYRPDDVEDYASVYELTRSEMLYIQSKANESIGEVIGINLSNFGVKAIALDLIPGVRAHFRHILVQAEYSKNFVEWFVLVIKRVVNAINGEQVFADTVAIKK